MAPRHTSRLVVGQNVVCRKTRRLGQVLGIAQPNEVCTVRYLDNGEVTTGQALEFQVASWHDLRDNRSSSGPVSDDAPTRVFRRPESQ